ncbi:MAG: flagellar biosynthetic protein FliO [Gammaproteobacteria bacterium]|jgi:flagellar protein FliO/FliZ
MRIKIAQWLSHSVILSSLFSFHVMAVESADTIASTARQSAAIGSESLNSGYLVQLVLGLMFVLLCIVALAWLAKRVNRLQSSSDGSLQVLGGLSMGARERVVLVQVGSTQLLLGVAPGRINMLHQLEQPLGKNDSADHGNAALSLTDSFSEKLHSALSGKRS